MATRNAINEGTLFFRGDEANRKSPLLSECGGLSFLLSCKGGSTLSMWVVGKSEELCQCICAQSAQGLFFDRSI